MKAFWSDLKPSKSALKCSKSLCMLGHCLDALLEGNVQACMTAFQGPRTFVQGDRATDCMVCHVANMHATGSMLRLGPYPVGVSTCLAALTPDSTDVSQRPQTWACKPVRMPPCPRSVFSTRVRLPVCDARCQPCRGGVWTASQARLQLQLLGLGSRV